MTHLFLRAPFLLWMEFPYCINFSPSLFLMGLYMTCNLYLDC